MSVSDIAKEIGKSAQTVRYHVNALIELDLILVVDERKRRSRTENLYVRKAVESSTQVPRAHVNTTATEPEV